MQEARFFVEIRLANFFFFSCFLFLASCFLNGLGCSLFARRYLGNRVFFLFLRLLRCFSSPGLLRSAYIFSRG